MAGNLDMALESLDMPPQLHDSMVEKLNQQSEPTPVVTSGSETPAPDATSATVTATTQATDTQTPLATEEQTTEEKKENTDDLIEIDPAKKIKVGDEILTWEQFQYRSMKKADLDKEKFQLNKERELLELEKQDSANAKYWKKQMEDDDFTRNFLQLKASGMSRDEAFASALKVGGITMPQSETPLQTAQSSLAIDPAALNARLPKLPANIEPQSEEHNKWYLETYEPAKMALIAQMTAEKVTAEVKAERAQEQKQLAETQARQAQEAARTKIIADGNQEQLNVIPQLLWTFYGIEVSKLSEADRVDATNRVNNAITEAGWKVDDPQWMSTHTIDPLHIKGLVRESFPEGRNPYVNSQKSSAIPERPKGNATPPLTASRTSSPVATSTNGAERYGSAMEAAVAGLDDK